MSSTKSAATKIDLSKVKATTVTHDGFSRKVASTRDSYAVKATETRSGLRRKGTTKRGGLTRYEVIIYWSEEDQAFVAEVPELPGCASDGKTYKEALENVEIVIQEWIETAKDLDRVIPEPKGRLSFA